MTLRLSETHRALLRQIIQTHLPGSKVAVFGSRVTGRSRPYSDVDLLVLQPPRLNWQQRLALTDALEASELPFRTDIVEWASLRAEMRQRIEQEAVAL
jgi:type I restriction enzyme S subunit